MENLKSNGPRIALTDLEAGKRFITLASYGPCDAQKTYGITITNLEENTSETYPLSVTPEFLLTYLTTPLKDYTNV